MSPRMPVAAVALAAAVLAAGACVQPQTVALPSPSPFAVDSKSPSPASPSLYSPGSTDEPGEGKTPGPSSHQPTRRPSPAGGSRPGPDVAGIRCDDEHESHFKGTTVVTRTTCYEIVGDSMAQLDAQMRRKGPRASGRRAIAVTRWMVRWSYDARSTGFGCELIAPSVETVAVYRFPTWQPSDSVSEGTVPRYRAFIRDVRAHEGHHRELAVKAGVTIRRALIALSPSDTCSMLEKKAGRTFDELFARYEAKQRAFDEAAGGIGY